MRKPLVSTLAEHLDAWAGAHSGRRAIALTMRALADASAELSGIVAQGPLAGAGHEILGASDDGDGQKALDVRSNELFLRHLKPCPVAAIASEEMPDAVVLDAHAPLAVAMDPLDGSNNIEINAPLGSMFTVFPADPSDPAASFMTAGERQLAAGFVLYGPHSALVLTLRDGVHIFALDREAREWRQTHADVRIPEGRREYAINGSNARHWSLPIRAYVEECLAGSAGPRGTDYNTRWLGCVAGEAYRILLKGGVYLYPGDVRPGYERGRLRLLYEANPLALVFEQAGGVATDGFDRILDLAPSKIHQRVPLIFGSKDKVDRISELHIANVPNAGQRPLFTARGLFKS
jgi:fructose-1,6-bisphosphatase I